VNREDLVSPFNACMYKDGVCLPMKAELEAKVLELRKAETQRADFSRQLAAEREHRMRLEHIVDEVRARNRELDRFSWRRVEDDRPPASTTILLWITGGPLHLGEDYPDFGIFNEITGQFQANVGDDDAVVQVSHWMPEPAAPAKENPDRA